MLNLLSMVINLITVCLDVVVIVYAVRILKKK